MADERAEIEALVRKVVARTLGETSAPAGNRPSLLDEATLRETPAGSTLTLAPGTIVTPLAREAAAERHITLRPAASEPPAGTAAPPGARRVAIGSDHGGFDLKETLKSAADRGGLKPADLKDKAKQVASQTKEAAKSEAQRQRPDQPNV